MDKKRMDIYGLVRPFSKSTKRYTRAMVLIGCVACSPSWAANVNGLNYAETPLITGTGDIYYDNVASGFTEDLFGSGVNSSSLGGLSLSFQYFFDGSPGILTIDYNVSALQDSMTIIDDVYDDESLSLVLDFSGSDAKDQTGFFAKGALLTFNLPLLGSSPLEFFDANSEIDMFGAFYASQNVNFNISAAVEPIPLPSSSLLVLTALGGMFCLRRRAILSGALITRS